MKTHLLLVALIVFHQASAQITAPVFKAGFGVDADLRANFYNGFVQAGNDDWFSNGTPGSGQFVIDTTGAVVLMNRYAVDANSRKLPFYRTMRVPQFTVVNSRLWIDAVYIRDYNGQAGGDSTAFVLSNKNGDNPAVWTGGVTSVLDKNDIAEMMIHVKRAGASATDSLWFIGGMSLQGTNGNRYFDFELYQTDIFYSRATGAFSNYGPDAGHTSWKFDAAGNVTSPGDVIFTAEYSSSSLTAIEARIWVDRASMLITPTGFDWIGDFTGASNGSQFGYANIRPKTAGAYYTGLQSGNNTWAGPFGFIDGGNNVRSTYTARQYMEFSVNLTKLGLDPMTLLGGSACGLPFRRILVKTRTSTSFSSELKDFIGPFDFFSAPAVRAVAEVPIFCGTLGVSQVSVVNANPSSLYTWSTPDGSIYGSNTGTSITVDQPGTYIVSQQLLDGCTPFASDTVQIVFDADCIPMNNKLLQFNGHHVNNHVKLNWLYKASAATYFELQRSNDGRNFSSISQNIKSISDRYEYADDVSMYGSKTLFYRLKITGTDNKASYSNILRISLNSSQEGVNLYPNPARDQAQLSFMSTQKQAAMLVIYNSAGARVYKKQMLLLQGINALPIDAAQLVSGTYIVEMQTHGQAYRNKLVVKR